MATAYVTADVEDGTGKSTALIYELPAAVESWLTATVRGLTVFGDLATDALKDQALLKATNFAEDLLRERLDGTVLTKEQALLFPRVGCTSRGGRTFESDETPPDYLACIRHFAELEATAALVRHASASDVMSTSGARGSVTFRQGAQSVGARYPEPWALAMRLFDPCRRKETWAA